MMRYPLQLYICYSFGPDTLPLFFTWLSWLKHHLLQKAFLDAVPTTSQCG